MSKTNEVPEFLILADNVRYYRKCMKESQEVFAEACSISTDTVSLIERGVYNTSTRILSQIARHVGVTTEELFRVRKREE